MKLLKAIWRVLNNKDVNAPEPTAKKPKRTKTEIEKFRAACEREKEIATAKGEAWVKILDMDVDVQDLSNGSFELDWNEMFIANLIRFGYQGKTDADLVDQWFTDVCRNVVLETFEQGQADLHPVKKRDVGGGRREYE